MIKIDKKTKDQLLDIHKTKKISLEGNILKVIDTDGDVEFESYIKESIEKDKDNRRKRLDITKQIQSRNTDLLKSEKENERVNRQLQKAVDESEAQKNKAEELLLVSKQHFRNAEKKEKEQNVALQKALEADILLIVQHADRRSITTMPFKTYDYLNTGKLVLGLVYRNNEIEELLVNHGHIVCQVDNIKYIKEKLQFIYTNFYNLNNSIRKSNLTPELAVEKMIQLLNSY